MGRLSGKACVVTGAGAGIGEAIAVRLAEDGAHVAIADIDADSAERVAARLRDKGAEAFAGRVDVSRTEQVRAFVDAAARRFGRLDAIVNNAGVAIPGSAEHITEADWDRVMSVNLKGVWAGIKYAIPHLRAAGGGSIVNLSSAAGRFGFPLRSPYAAAKWGVIGFTKSLAIELGPERIRVNAILPGLVAGDRIRRVLEAKAQANGRSFAEQEAEALRPVSLRCYVTPQDIANMALYLCSPFGATISGQSLSVDGDMQVLA